MIAGKERGKRGDVPGAPACTEYVFTAKPDDGDGPQHGDHLVDGLHGIFPDVGPDGLLFIIRQIFLIGPVPVGLLTVDPVSQGVGDPLQRGRVQTGAAFTALRHIFGDDCFQLFRQKIGNGRKQHGKQRQLPVIRQQHDQIGDHHHSGVKYFGGKLPHAFHAGVCVRDDFGHHGAGSFQILLLSVQQVAVKGHFHALADLVGKLPDIKALEVAHKLNKQDGQNITGGQRDHFHGLPLSAQDVAQVLYHLAFKPGSRHHPGIIEDPCCRYDKQGPFLLSEIISDVIRRVTPAHGARLLLFRQAVLSHGEIHCGFPAWSADTAYSRQP